jgi:hypothetical protein
MKVFDSLYTADGFEIYWLHDHTDTTLQDPENDLYYDYHSFYEACEEIVQSGAEDIDWKNEDIFSNKELEDMKNGR